MELIAGDDKIIKSLITTRGAVSPASTDNSSALLAYAMADFVGSLAPLSTAARLIGAGVQVSLVGAVQTIFPRRTGSPDATIAWIAQGAPFPVKGYAFEDATIGPLKKLAVGCALTREMTESSDGETIVGTLLREDVAATLDATLFSTNAATATAPAGLLNGLVAQVASAATPATEALIEDLSNLAAAVGTGHVVYIAAVGQAAAATARLTVWPCAALAKGTVVALDPAAFVSAFGPTPRITATRDGAVHLENTTPLAIGTAGTPATVTAPTVSPFQMDLVVVRAILDANYMMRASGLVAVVNTVTWGPQ
jgi:hypothetical protein